MDYLRSLGVLRGSNPIVWGSWNRRPRFIRGRNEASRELPEQQRELRRLEWEEDQLVEEIAGLERQIRSIDGFQSQLRDYRQQIQAITRRRRQLSRQRARNEGSQSDVLEQQNGQLDGIETAIRRIEQALEYRSTGATLRDRIGDLNRTLQQRENALNRQLGPDQRRRRQLVYRINSAQRDVDRSRAYLQPLPPSSLNNPHAVNILFARSGVQIKYMPHSRHSLQGPVDPVFGVALYRFFCAARREMGISEVYTNGFTRPPVSPIDTHSRGDAMDIKGFKFGSHLLLLRSGRMMSPGDADYNDLTRGHSDWFDIHGTIPERGGRTHEQMMRDFVSIMPRFFGQIVGPGQNAEHMNHFHVQLVGYQGASGAVMTPATRSNPRPYQTRRRRG